MPQATVGLYVPFEGKAGQSQTLAGLLAGGKELLDAEPDTLGWYSIRLSENQFAGFDAFTNDAARNAHLTGKMSERFGSTISTLIEGFPAVSNIDIFAYIVKSQSASTEATVGLYVPLIAKAGKAEAVKNFLLGVLPFVEAEPETLQWYAFRKSETEFGIFDTATGESGRKAHLNGKAVEALMANAGELLVTPPNIQNFDIIMSKVVE